MTFTHAIVRLPGSSTGQGLTTSDLGAPDEQVARAQFDTYVKHLLALRLSVIMLPPEPAYPDSHFVEDTAVVMPELAVITHPGAPSRRGEVDTIVPALAPYRKLARMSPNARMDGGDVLMVGKRFFIGLTERTDAAGIAEFTAFVAPHGYSVQAIEVSAGLHLKSIVNYVGRNTLTVNEEGARNPAFAGFDHIVVSGEEEYAGNTLLINNTLITPLGYPRTLARLQALDLPIIVMDTSEFKKMDGGLTCLSLRF
ncbi:MAG: amidinotransferase [Pseudomonadota bacterium]